jgi:hypothetical protein
MIERNRLQERFGRQSGPAAEEMMQLGRRDAGKGVKVAREVRLVIVAAVLRNLGQAGAYSDNLVDVQKV